MRRRVTRHWAVWLCLAVVAAAFVPTLSPRRAEAGLSYTVYVGNYGSGTLTPINASNNTTGSTIATLDPQAIAITPDGTKAYVVNHGSNSVTPITVSTNAPGTAIAVGSRPDSVAVTPDGATAYIANYGSNSITPINTSTNSAGATIPVNDPSAIAITLMA